jgi:hypothetical protein
MGTIPYHFLPAGSGKDFTFSRILSPFAPLRDDAIILYGLSDVGPQFACGGGSEGGTVLTTTGASIPGCRANGGQADDSVAGGPSFDQIFLKNVPQLQRPGVGYVNAICDARVDSFETSAQCLSYSYTTRSVQDTKGGSITESVPLLPHLRPADTYAKLFSGFMPGGSSDPNATKLLRALQARKSALDFSLDELKKIKTLAPASEAAKIDIHADAIRKVEQQISDEMNGLPRFCSVPWGPDPSLMAKWGSSNDTTNPKSATRDDPLLEQIGKAHAAVILAAFQCDIIRVATFQWAPGTNHVSFGGLFPADPSGNYMHCPTSYLKKVNGFYDGPPPSDAQDLSLFEFMTNVHTWYNQKTADILTAFKNAKDGFGGAVLDTTIVPFVTEIANANNNRAPKPSLLFGGSKLGMLGGQYLNFSMNRPQTDLWATIAQAYFGTTTPLANLSNEVFVKTNVGVIDGLWTKP